MPKQKSGLRPFVDKGSSIAYDTLIGAPLVPWDELPRVTLEEKKLIFADIGWGLEGGAAEQSSSEEDLVIVSRHIGNFTYSLGHIRNFASEIGSE